MTYTKKIFRKITIIPILLAIGFMFTTPMLLDVAAAPGGNGNGNGGNNSPSVPKMQYFQTSPLVFQNTWAFIINNKKNG